MAGGSSLLASQLGHEPPAASASSSSLQSSLLASTLSQGIPLASEESKRNEILAQLILDGSNRKHVQVQQPQQPQGLLMCAWADHPSTSGSASSSTASMAQRQLQRSPHGQQNETVRHIPVATLPTKPINRCPMASATVASSASTVTSGAAELIPPPSSAGSATYQQPLNLSKRPVLLNALRQVETSRDLSNQETTSQAVSTESSIPTKA